MSIKAGTCSGSPCFSEVDHRALLNHVFPESLSDEQVSKPLNELLSFHNLEEYIDNIELQELANFSKQDDSASRVGFIGPNTVLLDNETNVGGQVLVESNRLTVTGHGNFSTIRANSCVFSGKWQYEVCLSTCGLMQLGWCTLGNNFVREKGVGDTPNSYAFDGARVRKWNIQSLPYGEAWDVEDVISCCIDCNEGTVSFSRNGVNMGVAFDYVALGPGFAYFPAVSLSSGETITLNFGGTPFIYPIEGYAPLQSVPLRELACAQRFLNHFERLVPLAVETSKDELSSAPTDRSRKASCWLIATHLLNKLASHLTNPFIVEKLLLNFYLRFCDTSAVDANQSYVICVLQFVWAILEEECVHLCLDQTAHSLVSTYRFAPVLDHLTHQKSALCLLATLVRHAPTRLHLLNSVFFDNGQFLAVFHSKNVASAVSKLCDNVCKDELEDYCSYFFNKEASFNSGESALKKSALGPLMSGIEKDFEELERYQDEIMFYLLCDEDHIDPLQTSRSIFARKLREQVHEEQATDQSDNSASATVFLSLFHRLVCVLRRVWSAESAIYEELPSFDALYIPVDMFCHELPSSSNTERLGGQLAYLKKTFKEELASIFKSDRRTGPPDRERRSFFALKRVSEDPQARSRRLFRERCSDELNMRSKQLSSLVPPPDTSNTAGSSSTRGGGSYGLVSLLDIVDSVVLLFQVCVHKQFVKYTSLRERAAEYHAAYTSTQEKLQRCPTHRTDIRNALLLARDIFKKRLHEFRSHLAWTLSVVFCPRRATDIHWLLRVLLNTFQENEDAALFRFLPEVYVEAIINAFHVLHDHFRPMLSFDKEVAAGDSQQHVLGGVARFLIRAYNDRRVNSRDLKDSLLHCLSRFTCSIECLAALESLASSDAECFVRMLLAPYENRSWAQTNVILVRMWKGCGFGFRYSQLPHLSGADAGALAGVHFQQHNSILSLEKPLPSVHYQRVIKRMLEQDEELSWRLIDSLLTQLNWAFSEFVGAAQELQHCGVARLHVAADNRQLKVCATCFDIAVSLLRVLEMVSSLLPELFVDKSNIRPQSDLFASRLFQIIGQVLNRLATRSSLLDGLLTNQQSSALQTVDRYLILAPVTGILIQLIRNSSAVKLLIKETSFQPAALHRLLGREPSTDDHKTTTTTTTTPGNIMSAARRFSFFNYPDAISSDEVCQLEELIVLVDEEAKCMSEAEQAISDDNLCSICCASELSVVFKPCEHQSCKSCITHQMMNKPECFFCKAVVLRVEDLKGNPIRWK